MSRSTFSFIKENSEAYAKCHEILDLPEGVDWTELKVTFGSGKYAEIQLWLIPSGEQVRDLAELAIQQIQDIRTGPAG